MIFTSIEVSNFRSIAESGTLPLGPITLIIGRNNTGKSSLLHAIYLLQEGSQFRESDIRVGEESSRILLSYQGDIPLPVLRNTQSPGGVAEKHIQLTLTNSGSQLNAAQDGGGYIIGLAPGKVPDNVIYPVFAGRVQRASAGQVDRQSMLAVWPHDGNIVARVASLATAQFAEAVQFRQLCRDVLGFEISVIPGDHGQHLGMQVDRFSSINIDSMGTGVAAVLNLIVSLCGARGKLFLIEELENDLHPYALKALLDAILAASEFNQFIISTHSSIVLAKLGSLETSVVLHTSTDEQIPPSTSYEVVSTPSRRVDVLQELGYEISDLHLSDGWMIFEESSAERLVRQYLIPWFASGLRGIRTVAAGGTSRVEPIFTDFVEMLLFAHLEPMYKGRAWVVVDGDDSGVEVISKLSQKFQDWPSSRFNSWESERFEDYYPEVFQDKVQEVFSIEGKADLRRAKKELLDEVLDWIEADEVVARAEFEKSAGEVIAYLCSVETELAKLGRPKGNRTGN
ncbi:AAA family ATPase [Streptomyces sp. SID14515]|uniref:AAA family ATPase n=1 Tax=Streptomyces sp. SID14515 TaxID=2706074 RepID=UPI0013CBC4F5|nr:AAA family ATPase [Streptomyces sp. SID14515]